MITALISREHRRAVKSWLKHMRRVAVRRLRRFDAAALLGLLRRLGVRPGDLVLLHSSWDRFEGFTGKPTDVIRVLQEAVGSDGTLIMPTLPFTGTALDWAARGPVFDVARTPSAMGLLTELFRRSPGVVRSVHPTHSVAAWGARALEITAEHHRAGTPCGAGSPFARLVDHGGKILFLGTGIGVMTFFHTVEELLEPTMPFTAFTAETFTLQSRSHDGTLLETTTRLFEPARSRRRNLARLVPALMTNGAWQAGRLGGLDAILLNASDILDTCRELASKGVYCYDD